MLLEIDRWPPWRLFRAPGLCVSEERRYLGGFVRPSVCLAAALSVCLFARLYEDEKLFRAGTDCLKPSGKGSVDDLQAARSPGSVWKASPGCLHFTSH